MTRDDLVKELNEKIELLEVYSGNAITSKSIWTKRHDALTKMVDVVNKAMEENKDDMSLIMLRNRINHSLRIMDLAMSCGIIVND